MKPAADFQRCSLLFVAGAALFAAVGCGGDGDSGPGTPGPDAAGLGPDAAVFGPDAAAPGPDLAAPGPDVAPSKHDAPAAPPLDGGAADAAPTDGGGAPDAAVMWGANGDRVGLVCPQEGFFGFGDGSLLVCKSGKWRYAVRGDVPDGTYGAFTSRPDWYPPLRKVFNLPEETCRVSLTAAPIAADKVSSIIPYGMMVAGHVTPIDHAYIVPSTLTLTPEARAAADYVPVRAPADGVILGASSLGSPTSMRVEISHGCETVSIFMVLNKLSGPLAPYQDEVSAGGYKSLHLAVKAGDVIGLQRDNPVDYSLHDGATWLSGFAHPFPYVSDDAWKPYTIDPLPYFTADIRDAYTAKMQRPAAPRIGRIDWDKDGTAAGNWYLEGTMGYKGRPADDYRNATAGLPGGPTPGKNGSSWGHLSLSPHWVQPSTFIASIGAWADPAGDFVQYAIQPGPPAPDALTPAMGMVVYELSQWGVVGPNDEMIDIVNPPIGYKLKLSPMIRGVLAVRVNANHTITVEKRPDLSSASAFTAFTDKAQTYWR